MPKENVLKNESDLSMVQGDSNLSLDINLTTPTEPNHVANKEYIDNQNQKVLKEAKDYADQKQEKVHVQEPAENLVSLKWNDDVPNHLMNDNTKLITELGNKADKADLESLNKLIGKGPIDEDNSNQIIPYIQKLQQRISSLENSLVDVNETLKTRAPKTKGAYYIQDWRVSNDEPPEPGWVKHIESAYGGLAHSLIQETDEKIALMAETRRDNNAEVWGRLFADVPHKIPDFEKYQYFVRDVLFYRYEPAVYNTIVKKGLGINEAADLWHKDFWDNRRKNKYSMIQSLKDIDEWQDFQDWLNEKPDVSPDMYKVDLCEE